MSACTALRCIFFIPKSNYFLLCIIPFCSHLLYHYQNRYSKAANSKHTLEGQLIQSVSLRNFKIHVMIFPPRQSHS